jgi:hypothetical protein
MLLSEGEQRVVFLLFRFPGGGSLRGRFGALALRTGRVLEWDAQAARVTNDPEANDLIAPPYRAGWSL